MNKTRVLWGFLLSLMAVSVTAETLELYPTFENCSYYYNPTSTYSVSPVWNTDSLVCVEYQAQTEMEWKKAFKAVYDASLNQFRGSLFHLKEDTEYAVRVRVKENGTWSVVATGTMRTWSSNPPLKSTIKLGSLGLYKADQPLTLTNMKGSESGWIKIVGNVPVHAGATADDAILIKNCEYLILEGFVVTGGRINGITIDESCKNIRIINADISGWGRVPVDQVDLSDATHYPSSKYANYDATYLDDRGELIRNDAGIRIVTSSNVTTRERFNFVIERCYIHDQNGYANPWYGTRTLGYSAGKAFRFLHPQGCHGLYIRSSGSVVVRYNDIAGSDTKRLHDGSGGMDNGKPLGGYYRDTDIYGNYFGFGQDDGLEMDGSQINLRFYNNRIEQFRCGLSTAPCLAGPSYVMGNVIYDLGDSERDHGAAVKNGGGTTYSKGLQFFLQNTMYVGANCIASVGYGSDSNQGMYQGYTRNNILYSTTKNAYGVYEQNTHENNSFDYDLVANSKRTGREGAFSIQTLYSELHAVKGDPQFTDLDNRVFSLTSGSIAIGKGEYLQGISEQAAPDMGALPIGSSSLYPQRPIALSANKYQLRIHPEGTAGVKIEVGEGVESDLTYAVEMSEEMDWLTCLNATGAVTSGSTIHLHFAASVSGTAAPRGVVFVRLSNGYSVPISVVVNATMPQEGDDVSDYATVVGDENIRVVGRQVYVTTMAEGMLRVYDVMGRLCMESQCPSGTSVHMLPEDLMGVAVIQMSNGGRVKKVVL